MRIERDGRQHDFHQDFHHQDRRQGNRFHNEKMQTSDEVLRHLLRGTVVRRQTGILLCALRRRCAGVFRSVVHLRLRPDEGVRKSENVELHLHPRRAQEKRLRTPVGGTRQEKQPVHRVLQQR